jgi:uncharacterized protein (DUF2235 family)
MAKNIVVCLDGTNNKLRAAVKTNVVRLFAMLDLSDPDQQVGYYDPGVGTFSSSAAWIAPGQGGVALRRSDVRRRLAPEPG